MILYKNKQWHLHSKLGIVSNKQYDFAYSEIESTGDECTHIIAWRYLIPYFESTPVNAKYVQQWEECPWPFLAQDLKWLDKAEYYEVFDKALKHYCANKHLYRTIVPTSRITNK